MVRSSGERLILPAVILACIGCLQPGIDPVFLTLLSSAHGLAPAYHGWIVSATQTGMAIGSLATWRWGMPRPGLAMAAVAAVLAALGTARIGYFPVLLAIRALYGTAMGSLYTQAMSNAAIGRPHGAYGAVFLCQLMVSTGIALVLPAISDVTGAKTALNVLAIPPLVALVLVTLSVRSVARHGPHGPQSSADANIR
ncbi:MAG: MFS transporter, partial [Sphingobium sp.]